MNVPAMHAEHRARFARALGHRSLSAVIPTAPERIRNSDTEHRFRPDSDFWYLTGFAEPGAALVIAPAEGGGTKSVLFLREKDPAAETWTGRRLGVDAAPEALGVDEAFPEDELWERLPGLLAGSEGVVWASGVDEAWDRLMTEALVEARGKVRSRQARPESLHSPAELLHEMRLFKTGPELDRMRRAAGVTAEAHAAAMAAAAPGVNEREIDALLEYTFRRRGGTGAAYTNIVAGGANACILHYVRNDRPLADGSLLLIDAGCEWDYYASDVTRTFPVSGTFTDPQRELYEVVLAAQLAAIDRVRPGASVDAAHDAAVGALCAGLCELGLLEGTAEEARESGAYRRFYMHRTSHWLGLDVHDRGGYVKDGEPRALEPGMVLTVEPGLYVAEDAEVDERWRGIGIRIEDDVLVTAGEPDVLTAAIPKTVADVEAACAAPGPAAPG